MSCVLAEPPNVAGCGNSVQPQPVLEPWTFSLLCQHCISWATKATWYEHCSFLFWRMKVEVSVYCWVSRFLFLSVKTELLISNMEVFLSVGEVLVNENITILIFSQSKVNFCVLCIEGWVVSSVLSVCPSLSHAYNRSLGRLNAYLGIFLLTTVLLLSNILSDAGIYVCTIDIFGFAWLPCNGLPLLWKDIYTIRYLHSRNGQDTFIYKKYVEVELEVHLKKINVKYAF